MQAFIPKSRRPKFELQLKIIDLNNVPLVSGISLVKWDLPHSSSAEHRGRTQKCHIKDHKVTYDYKKQLNVKLTVDKSGMLQESFIHLEVVQEYSGTRGERITLGTVKLNLAEYVDAGDVDGEDGVCRRYLMQDSKINSTLKIGIRMALVDGDHNFTAPPLKSAPVFGGIAGIIAGEAGESDEAGHVPNLTSKSRETREIQDLYRRNLAAFWNAQPGELRADDCIEDIFAGGDGWAARDPSLSHNGRNAEHHKDDDHHRGSGRGAPHGDDRYIRPGDDDEETLSSSSHHQKSARHLSVPWVSRFHMHHHNHNHHKEGSFSSPRSPPRDSRMSTSSYRSDSSQREDNDPYSSTGLSPMLNWSTASAAGRNSVGDDENAVRKVGSNGASRNMSHEHGDEHGPNHGSIEQHARDMKAEVASNRFRARNEIDEFDIREDLKSWRIGHED